MIVLLPSTEQTSLTHSSRQSSVLHSCVGSCPGSGRGIITQVHLRTDRDRQFCRHFSRPGPQETYHTPTPFTPECLTSTRYNSPSLHSQRRRSSGSTDAHGLSSWEQLQFHWNWVVQGSWVAAAAAARAEPDRSIHSSSSRPSPNSINWQPKLRIPGNGGAFPCLEAPDAPLWVCVQQGGSKAAGTS